MNKLDDDAEAFFRNGDEGTYVGGPASIVPLVCEEPAEAWDLESADEWLERRRRLKRFVATVVGGLGAGLAILSLCVLAARARSADDVNPTRQAALPPQVKSAPVVPAATTVAEAPVAMAEVPAAVAEPESQTSTAEATAVPEPAPVVQRVDAPRSRAPSPRRIWVTPSRTKAPELPRGSANLPSVSGVVSGSTAAFSN